MLHKELRNVLDFITNDPRTLVFARFNQKFFTRNREMLFPDALSFLLDMRTTTLQTRLGH